MFNQLTLTREILHIFVEVQAYGRHHDRHMAWVARRTEQLATARDGHPDVVGTLAICRDGYAFRVAPLNPPAPARRRWA